MAIVVMATLATMTAKRAAMVAVVETTDATIEVAVKSEVAITIMAAIVRSVEVAAVKVEPTSVRGK